jgi:hypothetical protein
LGEPDEGDGVVVDEGVDVEEVREFFALLEVGGVLPTLTNPPSPLASPGVDASHPHD